MLGHIAGDANVGHNPTVLVINRRLADADMDLAPILAQPYRLRQNEGFPAAGLFGPSLPFA
ncbi:hypothetical protein D1872_323800 [compost metagenome]